MLPLVAPPYHLHRAGHPEATRLQGQISRKTVKQTVMTTVYGVTAYGARNQIARQLRANVEQNKLSDGEVCMLPLPRPNQSPARPPVHRGAPNRGRLGDTRARTGAEFLTDTPLVRAAVGPVAGSTHSGHHGPIECGPSCAERPTTAPLRGQRTPAARPSSSNAVPHVFKGGGPRPGRVGGLVGA